MATMKMIWMPFSKNWRTARERKTKENRPTAMIESMRRHTAKKKAVNAYKPSFRRKNGKWTKTNWSNFSGVHFEQFSGFPGLSVMYTGLSVMYVRLPLMYVGLSVMYVAAVGGVSPRIYKIG